MKLLQIVSELNVGSVGRIAEQISKEVLNAGHESIIAYGRVASSSEATIIKIGNKFNVFSHVLETRLFDSHGFGSRLSTFQLIKKIRKISPDIVHLHHLHGYYINIFLLFRYLKSEKIPVVWTFHDCWSFTGHCAYYDYVQCDKWKVECYSCPQKRSYPSSIILDMSRRNFLRKKQIFTGHDNLSIVTVSRWLKGQTKQSFLKCYEIQSIHNGIDISVFSPVKSDFRAKNDLEDKFLILGVASPWDTRKGLDYFVSLRHRLTDYFAIVVVGVTDEQIAKLPHGILGLRRTDSVQELASIYSAANVFLNPTLEDNFPTTNLEALACGTPVITFETGGSPEALCDKTGIVVPKFDLNGLESAIMQLYENRIVLLSDDCRRRAVKHFDSSRAFKKYLELYSEILENNKD